MGDRLLLSADELTATLVTRLRARPELIHPGVIRSFCKVSPATAREWLVKGTPLGGLVTLRLWHLMEAAGFDSPELRFIREEYPEGEYLGRLIAYSVITMEDAREMAQVAKDQRIFQGARLEGRLPGMQFDYDQLVATYGSKLEDKEQELRNQLGSQKAVRPNEDLTVLQKRDVFQIAKILESALPGLRVLASGDATEEQRAYLLELMGEQGMFELGNLIHDLSSWRAFQERDR